MSVQDRTTLRSAYLYLVCLITFVMVVFAAVSAVRNVVELAYPDRGSYAFEPAFGPDGKELLTEAERESRQQAAVDSQQRQAVLGLVGSGALLLISLTALAGAATTVAGIMLLTGALTADDLGSQAVIARIEDSARWWVLYALLAVAGVVLQVRFLDDVRRSVRAQWAADGGRELYGRERASR